MSTGTCRSFTQDYCLMNSGTWFGAGTPCDPNPCPEPLFGCCLPDTTCELRVESSCLEAGGRSYHGGGCSPEPCLPPGQGACCFGYECEIRREADCYEVGGAFGDGENCPYYCWEPAVLPSTWGRVKSLYR